MTQVDSGAPGARSAAATARTAAAARKPVSGVRQAAPKLSVDRIADAAIELASRDGVAGVSMARLATRLGSGTMSLYRHVASREDLLTLMVDRALGPPTPAQPAQSWRPALTRWARQLRNVLDLHPWLLHIPIVGPPQQANALRHVEAALEVLAETGLSDRDKFSCVVLVSGFVRHDATLRQGVAHRDATAAPRYAASLAAGLDPSEFPRLQQALAADAMGADGVDEHFVFGLELILDGLQRRIDENRITKA